MAKMSEGSTSGQGEQRRCGRKGSIPKLSLLGFGVHAMAMLPRSDGFVVTQGATSSKGLLSYSFNNDNLFSPDMLERARVPLYWETQRLQDAQPVLNLSSKNSESLSLSDEAIFNRDNIAKSPSIDSSNNSQKWGSTWEDGDIWIETERQLISMGVLFNETTSVQPPAKLINSGTMLDRAPQLIRLPTSQVIESTKFFIDERISLKSLIQQDPALITYCADDLYYGMEYLSNMMTRGNETQAIQMIQVQCAVSPQMALSLFRMGVDGGIDEKRVANALGKAASASGKAIEYTVGDAGRSYREFKRLKGGKSSLG
jgi:hypothetical protein